MAASLLFSAGTAHLVGQLFAASSHHDPAAPHHCCRQAADGARQRSDPGAHRALPEHRSAGLADLRRRRSPRHRSTGSSRCCAASMCGPSSSRSAIVGRANPGLVRRIAREGHLIGDHTHDHVDLAKAGDTKAAWQIEHGDDPHVGLRAAAAAAVRRGCLQRAAARLSRPLPVCSCAPGRSTPGTGPAPRRRHRPPGAARRRVTPPVRSGGVVIMHMNGDHTGRALPGVIHAVRARRLTCTLCHADAMGMPQADAADRRRRAGDGSTARRRPALPGRARRRRRRSRAAQPPRRARRERSLGLGARSTPGVSAPTPATGARVAEVLAGGCLTTAFVAIQHQGVVRQVGRPPDAVRDEWLAPLCRGDRRAGVAIAGIRPGADPLRARPSPYGWTLHGSVPWVTGWGLVDVVHVAALDDDGDVIWLLVDAGRAPSLRVGAAAAGRLRRERDGDGHVRGPRGGGGAVHACGRRTPTGSAPTSRGCARTARWPSVSPVAVPRCSTPARSPTRSTALVSSWMRPGPRRCRPREPQRPSCAGAPRPSCLVATGGRAVLTDQHAQRLAREAMFLLVFGSRPSIKAALQHRLT